ncbi:hypothetical protein G7Y89_g2592 [Cudoniella acicularis]|uniref:Uncharacterized protein n=1 Tax=Cudoniella acicularis TaxID=354080 RepID=A0A8H4RU84_9HELO|nr:hypothetical protein G7Y89_g2592 [Cudoniella acicularis]
MKSAANVEIVPIIETSTVDEVVIGSALNLESSTIGSVKSRKENMQDSPRTDNEGTARKVAQPFSSASNSGNKRQRVVTPAASKVIDDEDEPRTSPNLRKISNKTVKQEPKENERRVLGGIENI